MAYSCLAYAGVFMSFCLFVKYNVLSYDFNYLSIKLERKMSLSLGCLIKRILSFIVTLILGYSETDKFIWLGGQLKQLLKS